MKATKAAKQHIFNLAYEGLRSQGFQRAVAKEDIEIKVEGWGAHEVNEGSCMSLTPDGLRCAMGWAVQSIKAESVTEMSNRLTDTYGELPEKFVTSLVQCHDNSDVGMEMQGRLKAFAKYWRLTVPADKPLPASITSLLKAKLGRIFDVETSD